MSAKNFFIIFVLAVAVISYGLYQYIIPQTKNPTQVASQQSELEKKCLDSGGKVITSMCCQSASDFPNSCLIGACGCSPSYSHQIEICDCGQGKCFDGQECI